jgi:hypothetical protein
MQLRQYFSILKETYLRMNFIDEDKEKIDLVNMVVDSNFSIIGKSKRAFVVDQLKLDNKFAPLIFDELNDSTVDAQ